MTREVSQVYKKDEEVLDVDISGCETVTSACGSQRQESTCSSETNMSNKSISDLDDDEELVSLFKLAVIFTRGNPFDSRKHWRMRCEFLETNLRIGCLEKLREVDEDTFLAAESVTASSPPKTPNPVVRVIQSREGSEDCAEGDEDDGRKCGLFTKEVSTDEAVCGCNMKDCSCASESGTTVLVNPDDIRGMVMYKIFTFFMQQMD